MIPQTSEGDLLPLSPSALSEFHLLRVNEHDNGWLAVGGMVDMFL